MWTDGSGIMGIGYEGADAESFIRSLKSWGVETLVDVRLLPLSRKKGFSKRALADLLIAANIDYIHLPALGNPKDNRAGFSSPGSPEALSAHARYMQLLRSEPAEQALSDITELALRKRVVTLCFEASERCCHRQFVLEAVKERLAAMAPC